MVHTAQISLAYNDPFNLFLAMQREVAGREPWDMCLLPRPHTPEVGLFTTGMRMLRDADVRQLPIEVAEAADVPSFAESLITGGEPAAARGWERVRQSLGAVEGELRSAIEFYAPPLADATAYIEETVLRDEQRCTAVLTDALGVRAAGPLPVYLVPFAPFPPGTAFLTDRGAPRAAYLDYRRYSGPAMLEGLLTLLSWHLLLSTAADGALPRRVATGLSGSDRAKRQLRAIVMKMLVALTAEHLVTDYDPQFRGTIVAFGTDLRFPRLLAAIRGPWLHYLHGRTSREKALGLINERLAGQPASWFVEQVDASSLAADFYLLEWLAAQDSQDSREAAALLAAWQPRLAADFARHLDYAIGAELAHYDGIPLSTLAAEMIAFIHQACEGNSVLRWPAIRRSGGPDAYRMAEAAFLGPGGEYGGEAWAPIALLMAQYTEGALPERVFIDQCFTLEHNNGCLFDKFFDTWEMQATLGAQSRGDLATLGARASAEVRRLLRRSLAAGTSQGNALWSVGPESIETPRPSEAGRPGRADVRTDAYHPWPPPGSTGCGSNIEPGPGARIADDPAKPLYRGNIRKPLRRDVPELRSVTAALHTDLGLMTLNLDPGIAPMAVGTFVQLARGEVAWRDPATGGTSTAPFYDGTSFHRIVPGFLLQAGDRTETGRGGPGFRYDEEPARHKFDRPFLVAMVNTGIVTNGSQFFITLAAAPHLDGQYTVIGEVADDGSRGVALRLSDASRAGRSDLRIKRLVVDAR